MLKITYWGVTGTLSAPLRPDEVTGKLTDALEALLDRDLLRALTPGPGARAAIQALIAKELPFHLRSTYGGNTTCVEVETPDAHIAIDCGSGFREFGVALDARWRAEGASARRVCDILVSHSHMDHTFATPFFIPYYDPRNSFTITGAQVAIDSLTAVLSKDSALAKIYFPPTFEEMGGTQKFRSLRPGETLELGATRVLTYPLNHPGGSMAFRIESGGRSFVFASDHEHQESPDPRLAEFSRGADLLYTEGQYTQAEYDGEVGLTGDPAVKRHGWGHSSIESCVRTAVAAGVHALHIGHRDPRRTDRDLARLETLLQTLLQEELKESAAPAQSCTVRIPYEGLVVDL